MINAIQLRVLWKTAGKELHRDCINRTVVQSNKVISLGHRRVVCPHELLYLSINFIRSEIQFAVLWGVDDVLGSRHLLLSTEEP